METTEAPPKTIIISAVVDLKVREELRRRAAANDRSLSAEIRRALAQYLGNPEREETK